MSNHDNRYRYAEGGWGPGIIISYGLQYINIINDKERSTNFLDTRKSDVFAEQQRSILKLRLGS
jgi:hypothetical protein